MIEYIEALRVDNYIEIAIIGAGGKTTLMKTLAYQLRGKLICTSSTKLSVYEGGFFERHLDLLGQPPKSLPIGVFEKNLLVTNGAKTNDGEPKLAGLNQVQLSDLALLCKKAGFGLIVEADGAKRRLMKAPADWEPVIPLESDLVIYVLNLGILGSPLSEELFFRSSAFSRLTGTNLGEPITIEKIVGFLNHPGGGLKGMPARAKKVLLLNNFIPDLAESGFGDYLKRNLSPAFEAVFLSFRADSGSIYQRLF